jgi:hypothetical protein
MGNKSAIIITHLPIPQQLLPQKRNPALEWDAGNLSCDSNGSPRRHGTRPEDVIGFSVVSSGAAREDISSSNCVWKLRFGTTALGRKRISARLPFNVMVIAATFPP